MLGVNWKWYFFSKEEYLQSKKLAKISIKNFDLTEKIGLFLTVWCVFDSSNKISWNQVVKNAHCIVEIALIYYHHFLEKIREITASSTEIIHIMISRKKFSNSAISKLPVNWDFTKFLFKKCESNQFHGKNPYKKSNLNQMWLNSCNNRNYLEVKLNSVSYIA